MPALRAGRTGAAIALIAAAAALGASPATAETSTSDTGGVVFVETPTIVEVSCVRRCASRRRAQGGSTLRIAGRSLGQVGWATFRGLTGKADDVRAKAVVRSASRVEVRVPAKAVSGPVVVGGERSESRPSAPLAILPPLPAGVLASKSHVFPIRGPHSYGEGAARFGAGRAGHVHQGQDVFARCGTPLVAARGGRVQINAFHPLSGNYLVIDGDGTGADYAYMHLAGRSPFRKGDEVATGQRIGAVGDSGNARGCHLHFELWTAPGWYEGGRPVDPLRALKAWDSWS